MKYFFVRITEASSDSTFTIYYSNNIVTNAIASKYNRTNNTTSPASGITYDELTTDEGVLIEVPKNTLKISLYDEQNEVCEDIIVIVGPYADISQTDVTCLYGSITLSGITGGTPPYVITVGNQITQTTGSTITFDFLLSGRYRVLIEDADGFINANTVTIKGEELLCELIIDMYPTTSNSNDGKITLKSTGGEYNLTYLLYKNTNYPYDEDCGGTLVHTITGITSGNTEQTVTGLTCGMYCFKVVDNLGCENNTQLIQVCSTPVQPATNYFTVNVRTGSNVSQVCTNAGYARIFSTTQIILEDGEYYVNKNGDPYQGGGQYFKNGGDIDCTYGQIINGYYTLIGTCDPCL